MIARACALLVCVALCTAGGGFFTHGADFSRTRSVDGPDIPDTPPQRTFVVENGCPTQRAVGQQEISVEYDLGAHHGVVFRWAACFVLVPSWSRCIDVPQCS
jgi:hypothetical protein